MSLLLGVKQPKGCYGVKGAKKRANKPNNPRFGASLFFKADVQTALLVTPGYVVLVLSHMQVLENLTKESDFRIWVFWLWLECVHSTEPHFLLKYSSLHEKITVSVIPVR